MSCDLLLQAQGGTQWCLCELWLGLGLSVLSILQNVGHWLILFDSARSISSCHRECLWETLVNSSCLSANTVILLRISAINAYLAQLEPCTVLPWSQCVSSDEVSRLWSSLAVKASHHAESFVCQLSSSSLSPLQLAYPCQYHLFSWLYRLWMAFRLQLQCWAGFGTQRKILLTYLKIN